MKPKRHCGGKWGSKRVLTRKAKAETKPKGRFEDQVRAGYAAFVKTHKLLGARKWCGKKFLCGAQTKED